MLTDKEFNHLCQSLLTTGAGKVKRIQETGRREPLTVDRLLVKLGLKPKPSTGLSRRLDDPKPGKLAVEKLVRAIKG